VNAARSRVAWIPHAAGGGRRGGQCGDGARAPPLRAGRSGRHAHPRALRADRRARVRAVDGATQLLGLAYVEGAVLAASWEGWVAWPPPGRRAGSGWQCSPPCRSLRVGSCWARPGWPREGVEWGWPRCWARASVAGASGPSMAARRSRRARSRASRRADEPGAGARARPSLFRSSALRRAPVILAHLADLHLGFRAYERAVGGRNVREGDASRMRSSAPSRRSCG